MPTNQPVQPLRWSDFDEYLKPEHLGGQVAYAVTEHVELKKLHPKPGVEQVRPVLYFVGKSKGLILTVTNQDYLKKEFGDNVEDCLGKRLSLRAVTKVIAGRELETIIIQKAEEPKETEK